MKADAMNQWLKHESLTRRAARDPLFKGVRLSAYDMPPMAVKFSKGELEQFTDPTTGATTWRALPPKGFDPEALAKSKAPLNVPQQDGQPSGTRPQPDLIWGR